MDQPTCPIREFGEDLHNDFGWRRAFYWQTTTGESSC